MPSPAERLGHFGAAAAAILARVPRIDQPKLATGSFSLVAQHGDETAGRCIEHRPVEAAFGGHILPGLGEGTSCRPGEISETQIFRTNDVEARSQRSALLMKMCGSCVADMLMHACQPGTDLLSPAGAALAAGEGPLRSAQFALELGPRLDVRDGLAGGERGEVLDAKVDADGSAVCLVPGLCFHFHNQRHVPVATAEREGGCFDGGVGGDRPVQADPKASCETFEDQPIAFEGDTAKLGEAEAAPPAHWLEAGKAGLLTALHAAVEAGEGVIDPLEGPASQVWGQGADPVGICAADQRQ